jgi:hypothetical protein
VKTIETTNFIEAPTDIVWNVITDFDAYASWNPFITELAGEPRLGGRLRATFTLPGRKPRTFTPTVVALEPGRRLSWLGRIAIPKLFDAEHILAVTSRNGGSEFVHTENFRGLLPPLLGRLVAATHEAFVAMDTALKQRAEMMAHADRDA